MLSKIKTGARVVVALSAGTLVGSLMYLKIVPKPGMKLEAVPFSVVKD